jgi:PAS domain S-box-containing protein
MAALFQGFRSLVENSPDAISLIDTQGEILYGSASTARIFGYQPEELLGRNCLDLIHPDDRDHSSRALQDVLDKPPGPLQWDARIRRKDGSYFWVESTISNLLFEREVQAIVVQQRDIDTKRAAEMERQHHAEELARSNLRRQEFAYGAARDLREPLRTISALTEVLVRRMETDSYEDLIAQFIVDSAARMNTLVDDLLAFAGAGMQEPPQSVDLWHAMARATQDLPQANDTSGPIGTVPPLPE